MGKVIGEFSEFVTYELEKFVTNSENSLRTRKIPLITLAFLHAATISLDSSLKRAERNLSKMKTTITFPICNLLHLWVGAIAGQYSMTNV
jgi:hypothetical protein